MLEPGRCYAYGGWIFVVVRRLDWPAAQCLALVDSEFGLAGELVWVQQDSQVGRCSKRLT